jgi:nitrite reductase (NADH) large subunit
MTDDIDQFLSDPERTVCFCHNVPLKELVAAIRAGAHDLASIQAETLASTGCGGCECDVLDILERELQAIKAGVKVG